MFEERPPVSTEASRLAPGERRGPGVYRIGEWLFVEDRRELRRGGRVRRLEPKPAAVLALLARRSGRVVSRGELLAAVWPQPYVTPDVLTQAIYLLRRALDDDARAPRLIETIPKTGYRLAASVRRLAVEEGRGAVAGASPRRRGGASRTAAGWVAFGALSLLALALAALLLGERGSPPADPARGATRLAESGWEILAASRPGAAAEALRLAETSLARHGASCEALALGAAAMAANAAAGEGAGHDGFDRARAMADSALALDPECHRALLGRGVARWLGSWDWAGGEADLESLLAVAPDDAAARSAYAQLLLFAGREAAAGAEAARALRRAPDSAQARLTAALVAWMRGRTSEARAHYLEVLRRDPGHPEARALLAKLERGPIERAADEGAGEVLDQGLERLTGKRRLRPGHLAVLYAEAGRSRQALEWLERAVGAHDPTVLFFRFDPRWEPLRDHPRYRQAMASLGLPSSAASRGEPGA